MIFLRKLFDIMTQEITYTDIVSKRAEIHKKFEPLVRKTRMWNEISFKETARTLHFGSGNIRLPNHREVCSMFPNVVSCDSDTSSGADYFNLDHVQGKFDLIISEHVLEHIEINSLIKTVAPKLCGLLDSDGSMLITIPNIRNFGGYFSDFDHKNHVPPVDIASIFSCFGVNTVDMYRWSKSSRMAKQSKMTDSEKMIEKFLEEYYELQTDQYVTILFKKLSQ